MQLIFICDYFLLYDIYKPVSASYKSIEYWTSDISFTGKYYRDINEFTEVRNDC